MKDKKWGREDSLRKEKENIRQQLKQEAEETEMRADKVGKETKGEEKIRQEGRKHRNRENKIVKKYRSKEKNYG